MDCDKTPQEQSFYGVILRAVSNEMVVNQHLTCYRVCKGAGDCETKGEKVCMKLFCFLVLSYYS